MCMCICVRTDDGWMHKAVQLGDQVHIIEELQLYKEPQPINNMVISYKQVQFSLTLKLSLTYISTVCTTLSLSSYNSCMLILSLLVLACLSISIKMHLDLH